MELNKLLLCRFCLKICKDGFEVIESAIENIVKSLLPTVDLSIVNEPVACNSCVHNLKQCFNFKKEFLHQTGFTYNDNKDVNLNAPTMNVDENTALAAGPSSGNIVCCLCVAIADMKAFTFVNQEGEYVASMFEKHSADVVSVDTYITEDFPACTSCRKTLRSHLSFLNNCVSVDEGIREYCKCVGSNIIERNELDSVLQFMLNRKLKDYTCVDLGAVKLEKFETMPMGNNSSIKVENDFFPKIENQEPDIIKMEHIEIKQEIKDSQDSVNVDIDGVDQPEAETEEVNARLYNCKLCGYSSEHRSKLRDHMEVHKTILQGPEYQCDKCTFNTKYKNNFLTHMVSHKSESEVPLYHCTECTYYTKIKRYLVKHMLVHNYLSEVKMYKCDLCPYETKRKYSLPRHMLCHQRHTEGAKHKCDVCAFRATRKSNLDAHMVTHKDVTEVTMYKCETCEYQSKKKYAFLKHTLVHKSDSEEVMYKCAKCPLQTKHKRSLQLHLLTHKSDAEVTMYKCDLCAFQTRYRRSMVGHVGIHKSASEVETFECTVCRHKTRHKCNMSKHMLTHEDRPKAAARGRSKRGAKKV